MANLAHEVLQKYEVCIAFETTPHVPIAGTSAASPFFREIASGFVSFGQRGCSACNGYVPKTLRRYGLPSLGRGFQSSVGRNAFR